MKQRKTLMRAVGRARRAWDSLVRSVTLSEGIPDSYRPVLLYLLRHPGAGQKNVAEFASITNSAVNQAVKSMLAEGYLVKETDPCDKRNTKLFLTEKGSAIACRVFEKLDAADDAITARLGAEREVELIETLECLAEYIREDLA